MERVGACAARARHTIYVEAGAAGAFFGELAKRERERERERLYLGWIHLGGHIALTDYLAPPAVR